MRRNILIIGAIIIVMAAIAIAAFFFMRGRSGAPPVEVPPVGQQGTVPEQKPLVASSSLRIETSTEEVTEVTVAIPVDPTTDQPAVDAERKLTAQEKESLGLSAQTDAAFAVTLSKNGDILLGNITVTDEAGEETVATIRFPMVASGQVGAGIPKALTEDEKVAIGLPRDASATITLIPTAGGMYAQFDVQPVVSYVDTGAGAEEGGETGGGAGTPGSGTAPKVGCGDYVCSGSESEFSCPEDCVLAGGDELLAHTSYPPTDDPADDSMRVLVETNVPVKGVMRYGPSESYGAGEISVDTFTEAPLFVVPEVTEGMTVYYSITLTDEIGGTRVLTSFFER